MPNDTGRVTGDKICANELFVTNLSASAVFIDRYLKVTDIGIFRYNFEPWVFVKPTTHHTLDVTFIL
jgi:hypothetical protein